MSEKLVCWKVQGAIVVTLNGRGCLYHTLKFYIKVFFYVTGKSLSGEVTCTWDGLVTLGYNFCDFQFAFQDIIILFKWGVLVKENICC